MHAAVAGGSTKSKMAKSYHRHVDITGVHFQVNLLINTSLAFFMVVLTARHLWIQLMYQLRKKRERICGFSADLPVRSLTQLNKSSTEFEEWRGAPGIYSIGCSIIGVTPPLHNN
jgi:hypothetical protein